MDCKEEGEERQDNHLKTLSGSPILWVFLRVFSLAGPSPRVLKLTGEKHAGNLGVG